MDRMTLKIDGMTCGHCVSAVTKALGALDGVEIEQVAIGTATVAYDPRATAVETITGAIEDEGYRVLDTGR
ncbi:MAG TPA: cation transporter [Gemmatimonadaceae bacterium]|nr:cation transporter [Gemmatimonadaceae bacterium]